MDADARHFSLAVADIDVVRSNVFMTFAWYGHLRFKGYALPLVITALGHRVLQYWLAVPASRWGSEVY
jgi:uncharacterized protein (DUF486 family)